MRPEDLLSRDIVTRNIVHGDLGAFGTRPGVVIGERLRQALNLRIGDKITAGDAPAERERHDRAALFRLRRAGELPDPPLRVRQRAWSSCRCRCCRTISNTATRP